MIPSGTKLPKGRAVAVAVPVTLLDELSTVPVAPATVICRIASCVPVTLMTGMTAEATTLSPSKGVVRDSLLYVVIRT